MNKIKNCLIAFCLSSAIAVAPICQANARSHLGDAVIAAVVGGTVAGLVSGAVQNTYAAPATVVSQPVYIEAEPVVVAPVVVHRPRRHYVPVRHVRHYRYY